MSNNNAISVQITGDASDLQRALKQGAASVADFSGQASSASGKATASFDATGTSAKRLATDVADALKGSGASAESFGAKAGQGAQQAAAGYRAAGLSAGQLQAAQRGLPAQFTDIIVSLQGGQKPLTVLMQQGGQLKDMFGGIGPAFKAVAGYALSLLNPFTIAAAAIGALGLAAYQGSQESRDFANASTLAGNAAGVSASQFSAMSQSMAAVAGTRGKAAETLTEIASTGQLAGANIQAIGEAAILMEKATGQAVGETIKQFIKLADEPAKASAELNKQYNYLTASVYEQIKALEAQGDKVAAANLAEQTYASAMAGRARTVVDNAGLMERAWRGIIGAAKGAWEAMLNVGRADTVGDKLGKLQKELDIRQASLAKYGDRSNIFSGSDTGRIATLKAEIGYLQETVRMEGKAAEGTAERARVNAAGIAAIDAVGKVNEQSASKQVKMNKALGDYRANLDAIRAANPESALLSAKSIAAAEAGIREQYKETAKAKQAARAPAASTAGESELAGIRAKAEATRDYLKSLQENGLAAKEQNAAEVLSSKLQKELEGNIKGVARANKEKALAAALAWGEDLKAVAAKELLIKAQKDFDAARDKEISGQEASILKIEEKAQAMEDQVRMYGLSKEALEALSIARLQERADILAGFAGSEEQISLIEKEIAARQRLAVAADQMDGLDAGVKAAKAADAEWKKTAHSIENTLTDSLMRAFEGGKGFARAMRDTIVNMFKTMVLRPIVQAVMAPVSAAIGSTLGLPGAANAGQGGAGSLASNASSIFSSGSNIFTDFGGTVASQGANFAAKLGDMGFDKLSGSVLDASNSALQFKDAINIGGDVLGYAKSIYDLSKGNYGAAVGGAIGTYFGGPIGSMIGSKIGGLLDGTPDKRFGSQGSYSATGGTKSYGGPNGAGDDFGGVSAANKLAAQGIDKLLETVGSKERLQTLFGGFESSEKGKGFSYAGGILSNGASFGQGTTGLGYQNNRGSMSPEQAQASYITELKQATLQSLQAATDIPKSIADQLKGVDIDALSGQALDGLLASIDKVIVETQAFQDAVKRLPFENLKNLSFDAADGLIQLSGGLDKLAAASGFYYENFYSESERAALAGKNLGEDFAKLNISLPASKDGFRALMDAQDLTTESGRKTFSSLMQLAPAFASVADAALASAARMQAQASSLASEYLDGAELRNFRAGEIVSTLGAAGINLTPEQILSAGRPDYLAALQSVAGDDKKTQALLDVGQSFAALHPKTDSTASSGIAAMFGGGGGSSGGSGDSAATSIASAWQSITDSIWDEVKRIRGLLTDAGADGFAAVQAKFAITNAQARAGDQDAAKLLPELSKNLLTLAEGNVGTMLDLQRIQDQTAATLAQTGTALAGKYGLKVPAFANGGTHSGGWAMVGEQGPELAYMPPARIYTASDTRALTSGQDSGAVVAELREQNRLLTALLAASQKTEKNTGQTADTLKMVTRDGEAMQTEAA